MAPVHSSVRTTENSRTPAKRTRSSRTAIDRAERQDLAVQRSPPVLALRARGFSVLHHQPSAVAKLALTAVDIGQHMDGRLGHAVDCPIDL